MTAESCRSSAKVGSCSFARASWIGLSALKLRLAKKKPPRGWREGFCVELDPDAPANRTHPLQHQVAPARLASGDEEVRHLEMTQWLILVFRVVGCWPAPRHLLH
ncbi:hypothetical protein NOVOSPHI9U_420218 [Novosphingobium sp. 9U]|nr:hypothetical protein NOVOSPHI9U_420218 [Novosphingobium sp. 9U]